MPQHGYVHALGFDSLTRFYDPFIALLTREQALKGRLLDQARLAPGQDVLDVGCGTGTLAILAKQRMPGARVVGLDGDPKVLAIARRKMERARLEIELREGLADASGAFPDASFDRILSTLMLHHLTREQKRAALAAMRAWLRPGGELHVMDFGPQTNAVLRLAMRGISALDGGERVADNLRGLLPQLIREAGFAQVAERGRAITPFGSVSYYAATRE
jgi:ubiquinone/menaquinone biosynthesis C-methylase UbiE